MSTTGSILATAMTVGLLWLAWLIYDTARLFTGIRRAERESRRPDYDEVP